MRLLAVFHFMAPTFDFLLNFDKIFFFPVKRELLFYLSNSLLDKEKFGSVLRGEGFASFQGEQGD